MLKLDEWLVCMIDLPIKVISTSAWRDLSTIAMHDEFTFKSTTTNPVHLTPGIHDHSKVIFHQIRNPDIPLILAPTKYSQVPNTLFWSDKKEVSLQR